jgi:hypothetical protein
MGRPIARRLLESRFKLTATWIRHRYMGTPIMSAATQVALGGALVFGLEC